MKTIWVIDASAWAAFFLRESTAAPTDELIQGVLDGSVELHAPAHFGFEMTNILLMSARRQRIPASRLADIMAEWELIPVKEHPAPTPPIRRRILALAERHRLSAYDASYLELAERLPAKLLTHDAELLALRATYSWIR